MVHSPFVTTRMGGGRRDGMAAFRRVSSTTAGRVESFIPIITDFTIGLSHLIVMRHMMQHDPYYQKRREKNRTQHRQTRE